METLQIWLPGAEEPLHCPDKEVGQQLGFKFIRRLEFESHKIFERVIRDARSKGVSPPAREWGKKYRWELKKGVNAPSEIRWINPKIGFGLFAKTRLPEDAFIGEYLGVVRCNDKPKGKNDYLFTYPVIDSQQRSLVIDGRAKGNQCRFINHSAVPNLTAQIAFDGTLYHIILIACREIQTGEQFCFNYGEAYWKERETGEELCG